MDRVDGAVSVSRGITKRGPHRAISWPTKGAVRSWTAELKDRRIRVNAISPGPIDTPIFDQQAPTKEGADQARA